MSDSVIEFGKQLVQKYKHKLGDECNFKIIE